MSFVRFAMCFLLTILLAMPALAAPDSLTRVTEIWKGDLPELLRKKRPIRVLVSYDRTNFFLVSGAMRGLEYDLMQAYEKYVRTQHTADHARMVFVAVPFDDLIPALLEGRGDIIAAGLTITTARKKKVAFATPYRKDITEIVVGSGRAARIHSLPDLAGEKVYAMAKSSHVPHLRAVSGTLEKRGMKPIEIIAADANLVTEDLLEMAERGMIKYTVADASLARIWKSALPHIQLFSEAPIHSGGDMGWAVRPGSAGFIKSLSGFADTVRQGTLMGNMIFKRYYVNSDWVKNPYADEDRTRLQALRTVFEKYARQYDFDWLKLAALAFQESRLDMNAKSDRGAVGIMQVKPATGAYVGVTDVETLDGNIHAGTKYLRYLRDNYFKDVDREAKVDFALAAYNAGPSRVEGLRRTARKMGLDPNRWFGNVEWAAYGEIGSETPTYVANVQMYYAAYKSIYTVLTGRDNAK